MKFAAARSTKSAWRPSWKVVLGSPIHFTAFGFGAGLVPKAPGTFGTLVGIPVWLLLAPLPTMQFAAALALLTVFGCWVCGASARRLGVHDYGGIVFDEIVGYVVTCIPLRGATGHNAAEQTIWLAVAFVAFRIFDIWKPRPIGTLDERVHGGVGIMLDDLIAGLYAALSLMLIHAIAHDPEFW